MSIVPCSSNTTIKHNHFPNPSTSQAGKHLQSKILQALRQIQNKHLILMLKKKLSENQVTSHIQTWWKSWSTRWTHYELKFSQQVTNYSMSVFIQGLRTMRFGNKICNGKNLTEAGLKFKMYVFSKHCHCHWHHTHRLTLPTLGQTSITGSLQDSNKRVSKIYWLKYKVLM